jgi:hypothetical protein
VSQQQEDRSTRELQLENQLLRREVEYQKSSGNLGVFVAGISSFALLITSVAYSIEKISPDTPVDNDGKPYLHKVTLYTNDPALAATAQDVFYTYQKALKAPLIPDNISKEQLSLAEEDPSVALMVTNAIIDGIEQHIGQVTLLSNQLLAPLEAELERHQIRRDQLNASKPLAWWMPPARDTENPVVAIEAYVFKAIFGNQYERA